MLTVIDNNKIYLINNDYCIIEIKNLLFQGKVPDMTTEQYMNMIRNNPYVIGRIENPTEEMQLLAVQLNGQALQYITNPSPAVQEAAIANTARAI